jgi:hypothetical protein
LKIYKKDTDKSVKTKWYMITIAIVYSEEGGSMGKVPQNWTLINKNSIFIGLIKIEDSLGWLAQSFEIWCDT